MTVPTNDVLLTVEDLKSIRGGGGECGCDGDTRIAVETDLFDTKVAVEIS